MKKLQKFVRYLVIIYLLVSVKDTAMALSMSIDKFTKLPPATQVDSINMPFQKYKECKRLDELDSWKGWAVFLTGQGYCEFENKGNILILGVGGPGYAILINPAVNFTVYDNVIYKIRAKTSEANGSVVIEPINLIWNGYYYIHLHANWNPSLKKPKNFYADFNNMSGDIHLEFDLDLPVDTDWHIFEVRLGNNEAQLFIDGKKAGYFISGKEKRQGFKLPDKLLSPVVLIHTPDNISGEIYIDWIKIEIQ